MEVRDTPTDLYQTLIPDWYDTYMPDMEVVMVVSVSQVPLLMLTRSESVL